MADCVAVALAVNVTLRVALAVGMGVGSGVCVAVLVVDRVGVGEGSSVWVSWEAGVWVPPVDVGVAALEGVGEEEDVGLSPGSVVVDGVGVAVVVPRTVRTTVAVRVAVVVG